MPTLLQAYRRDFLRIWVAGFLLLLLLPVPLVGVALSAGFFAIVHQSARGESATVGTLFSQFGRLGALLVAGLLMLLAVAPLWALAFGATQVFGSGTRALVLSVLPAAAFAFAALALGARWSLAIPLIVRDGLAGVAALRESAKLTRGRRWTAAAVQLTFSLVLMLPLMPIVVAEDYDVDRELVLPLFLAAVAVTLLVLVPLLLLGMARLFEQWRTPVTLPGEFPQGFAVVTLGAIAWFTLSFFVMRVFNLGLSSSELFTNLVLLPLALHVAPPPRGLRWTTTLHDWARIAQPSGALLIVLNMWLMTADIQIPYLWHGMWPAYLLTAATGVVRHYEERSFAMHEVGVALAFVLAGFDQVWPGSAPVLLASLVFTRLEPDSRVAQGAVGAVYVGGALMLQSVFSTLVGVVQLTGLVVVSVLGLRAVWLAGGAQRGWMVASSAGLLIALCAAVPQAFEGGAYGFLSAATTSLLFGVFLACGLVGARSAAP